MPYYNHENKPYSRFSVMLRLFSPSWLSLLLVFVMAVLLLGIQAYNFIPGNESLYELLFGESGIAHIMQISGSSLEVIYEQIANSSWSYILFVVLIALTAGAVVFLVVQLINRTLYDAATTWHTWSADPRLEAGWVKTIVVRSIFRLLALGLWLAFYYLTVKLIWPFCIISMSTGIDLFPSIDSLIYVVGYGLLLFMLTLHLHVVFLRLIALKTRLVGKNY